MPSSLASAAACRGPAPPKGKQDEAAGVDPPLDGHQAQGAQHLRLGHADDPFRAREHVHVELPRQRRHGEDGGGAVEREPSGQRRVLEQAAEQQVGVGDGRLTASTAVAGGSREGTRRGRSHAQGASGIAPGDRAAAGTHGVDVERRQRQRSSGDRPFGGLGDLRALDQADVAGGAAHVEAEHVRLARQLRQQQGPADASGGAGENRERGVGGGALGVGQAA